MRRGCIASSCGEGSPNAGKAYVCIGHFCPNLELTVIGHYLAVGMDNGSGNFFVPGSIIGAKAVA